MTLRGQLHRSHGLRGSASFLTWVCLCGLALGACGTGGGDDVADQRMEEQEQEAEQEAFHPTQVLVRPAADENIVAILADVGGTVIREIQGTRFFLVQLPSEQSLEQFLSSLRGDARVVDAETDRVMSSPEGGGATLPVGQELFPFSIVPDQPELLRIGAPIARSRATGAGMRVAVVDSGVVMTHVALAGKLELSGWDYVDGDNNPTDEMNGIDDDEDGLIDEGFGHGTFVSSLILAVAPDVTVIPYRVLNSDSTGLASDVADAIVMATDNGVDLINLSLGMEHRNIVVGEAIVYARDRNVMVVASAGNTGNSEVTFPATISVAATVASVDPSDIRADFTSFGPDVDLCAPGVELYGAYPVEDDVAVKWSGTSFSAALVSGGICLVRELHPTWGSPVALFHVEQSCDTQVLNLNGEFGQFLGTGRLDLARATE